VIGLFLKINLSTTLSMKTSRRELSIDMVIYRVIFKNNQTTLFPYFAFTPKTGISFFLCTDRLLHCNFTQLINLMTTPSPESPRLQRMGVRFPARKRGGGERGVFIDRLSATSAKRRTSP